MTKATDAMRAANTKHGCASADFRSGEYESWAGAKARCYNPNNSSYERYGGRGITMDPRWRDSFPAFLEDMGPRPSPNHSIDRIDNDGPYSPDNCRWATLKCQNRNRRSCLMVEFQGELMSLVDACEIAGQPYSRVQARMKYLGWPFDQAISEPYRRGKSRARMPSRPFPSTREARS